MTLAIKVVDLSKADEQTVSGFKNEITLLNQLRQCKRVVRMYDYEYQNNGQLLLVVMEKGDSDLSNVLKSFIDSEEKRSLDPHLIRFYWQEMVKVVIRLYLILQLRISILTFFLKYNRLSPKRWMRFINTVLFTRI
jgi:serine/threonine-protein kinase TTK/MPS1